MPSISNLTEQRIFEPSDDDRKDIVTDDKLAEFALTIKNAEKSIEAKERGEEKEEREKETDDDREQKRLNTLEEFPGPLSQVEMTVLRAQVKQEIGKPKHEKDGETNTEKLISVLKSSAQRYRVGQRKQKPRNSEDRTTQEPAELANTVKAQLEREFGARLACEIPITKAKTVYVGKDVIASEFVEGTQFESVARKLGDTQKDFVIMLYYFDQMSRPGYLSRAVNSIEKKADSDLSLETAKGILSDLSEIVKNYDTLVPQWKISAENRRSMQPSLTDLFEWTTSNNQERYGETGVEFAQNAWEAAQSLIVHEAGNSKQSLLATLSRANKAGDDRAFYDALNRMANSLYDQVSIPDALISKTTETEDGKKIARLEGITRSFTTYSPERVHLWVEGLKQNILDGEKDVRTTSPDPEHLNKPAQFFGFDPEQDFKLLNMANKIEQKYLDFSPEGGYGTVLRFSDDIPDQLLIDLGRLIEQMGYTNFVIQKIPFSQKEIKDMARTQVVGLMGGLNHENRENNDLQKQVELILSASMATGKKPGEITIWRDIKPPITNEGIDWTDDFGTVARSVLSLLKERHLSPLEIQCLAEMTKRSFWEE